MQLQHNESLGSSGMLVALDKINIRSRYRNLNKKGCFSTFRETRQLKSFSTDKFFVKTCFHSITCFFVNEVVSSEQRHKYYIHVNDQTRSVKVHMVKTHSK